MLKLSFKFQLALIITTTVAVVALAIFTIRKTADEAREMDRLALQATEFGISEFHRNIVERAMDFETGAIRLNLIRDFLEISGETSDSAAFWVLVTKDTISPDSIELRIEARGTFGTVTNFQNQNILLTSDDFVNWFVSR